MPESTVIPVLLYPDARDAVAWLCNAFGFRERLRIGDHRAQLDVAAGVGSIVVAQASTPGVGTVDSTHSIMVRIGNVDEHFARVKRSGARIAGPPATYPYGERQYSVVDPGGHLWTFSQTVANVEPSAWGGALMTEADT